MSPWKSRTVRRQLTSEDLQITDYHYGATLALSRCAACDFIFADGEELQQLTGLYEQLSDPAYLETQHSRLHQMRWLLSEIQRTASAGKTLLDIGAGAGLLVAEARRRGLDAVGVEPSVSLVQSAPAINGVDLFQGVFPHPSLRGRTFDIVCLVDVLEHVADPVRLLRDCAGALSRGGVLVVVTPDVGSVAARVVGRRWWHFRLAHVGYFNRKAMRQAALEAGLVISRSFRARWFFSVAYLAERLTQYLPLSTFNRLASRVPVVQRVYDVVVPINLRDSMVVVLMRREDQC